MSHNLPISLKTTREVVAYLKGRNLPQAKEILGKVITGKKPLPYRRAIRDLGHKKKIGPGRYPKKVSSFVLKMLNSLEKQAQNKGLNTNYLVLTKIMANKGNIPPALGRHRHQTKRTHLTIVAEEKKVLKND